MSNGVKVIQHGTENPRIVVSPERVLAWLRSVADEAGFADRAGDMVQLTVKRPFNPDPEVRYHHECPELLIMVSNIPGSREPTEASQWRPMDTAPKTGEPVLLKLEPPLNTGDCVGWVTPGELRVVVGWWSDPGWECGMCEEGSADSEGISSPFPITLKPAAWMPLPA